jgi:hypothetical protein
VLHVCRVCVTGVSQVTWVTGITLAVCTVSFGVTRYSLPYDQVDGPSVGQATLTRFYSLHTFVLPRVTLAGMPDEQQQIRPASQEQDELLVHLPSPQTGNIWPAVAPWMDGQILREVNGRRQSSRSIHPRLAVNVSSACWSVNAHLDHRVHEVDIVASLAMQRAD